MTGVATPARRRGVPRPLQQRCAGQPASPPAACRPPPLTRCPLSPLTQDLLIEFKTHDASRAPPLNLVQRLLQAEPAAYRENQLRQSVEALVRTRDEALGLVAECTALEREIGDIRGRIGITLQSTLRKAAPNPYPPL